jgi:hypothetical protein
MKAIPNIPQNSSKRANVLLMVLVMVGVSLTLVVAIFGYGSTNAKQNQRAADYYGALSAAEAATEKLVSQITTDYRAYGDGYLTLHMGQYTTNVPNSSESAQWTNYDFINMNGDLGKVDIQYYNVAGFSPVNGQYGPLKAFVDRYRVIANARLKSSQDAVVASVYQDIELDRIPIFQYAVFFNTILEFTPLPAMDVRGPVHCNTNIYFNPYGTLTMWNDVTAAGSIVMGPNPAGPLPNLGGTTVFKPGIKHDSGVSTLNLPIGTNNSPAAVHQVLELPAIGENVSSSIGQQRFYNKADLLILCSNTTVVVKAGPASGIATAFGTNEYGSWLSTNKSFYSMRELKTIRPIQIDVSKLVAWNASNSVLRPTLAARPNGIADIRIIYIYDGRTFTALNESGVRLINGDTLPPKGLTVATPAPIYVQGHYNCPVANRGTTNTVGTVPASLCGDAVTVLSTMWFDTNSVGSTALTARIAANTTVNAALLTGLVATTGTSDSGGVENFPRFLEDWTSKTLTYNGSMVCMFYSQVATGPWNNIGDPPGIYNPPTRVWGLDPNFSDENKLPPGTPAITVLVRSRWRTPAAFTTNVIAGF